MIALARGWWRLYVRYAVAPGDAQSLMTVARRAG